MFVIIWDEKALAELTKLETIVGRRIVKKVKSLGENPYSKDVKRLKGSPYFRLRVGDYRVLFDVERDTLMILKVQPRKNIYKKH